MRPTFGGNPLEFGDEIWRQKTGIMGLPDGEEIILTQYRRVTDGQTDGRADRHVAIAITRYSIYAVARKNQGCVLNELSSTESFVLRPIMRNSVLEEL